MLEVKSLVNMDFMQGRNAVLIEHKRFPAFVNRTQRTFDNAKIHNEVLATSCPRVVTYSQCG